MGNMEVWVAVRYQGETELFSFPSEFKAMAFVRDTRKDFPDAEFSFTKPKEEVHA